MTATTIVTSDFAPLGRTALPEVSVLAAMLETAQAEQVARHLERAGSYGQPWRSDGGLVWEQRQAGRWSAGRIELGLRVMAELNRPATPPERASASCVP